MTLSKKESGSPRAVCIAEFYWPDVVLPGLVASEGFAFSRNEGEQQRRLGCFPDDLRPVHAFRTAYDRAVPELYLLKQRFIHRLRRFCVICGWLFYS